jgi:hypothetical protein
MLSVQPNMPVTVGGVGPIRPVRYSSEQWAWVLGKRVEI